METYFILHIAVCTCQSQTPKISQTFSPGTIGLFSKSVSLFCKISSFVSFLFRFHIQVISYDICLSLSYFT